jgi:Zn-dependent peptidase ImmA (M78 family)
MCSKDFVNEERIIIEIRHPVAHQFICATEIRHSVAHES